MVFPVAPRPKLRSLALGAGLGLFAVTPVAVAQDQSSPLRFLKPWIEEQLGVQPGEAPAGQPATPPPRAAEPAAAEPEADAAAIDGTVDPGNAATRGSGPGTDPASEAAGEPQEPAGTKQPTAADRNQAFPAAEEAQGSPPPGDVDLRSTDEASGAPAPALPEPSGVGLPGEPPAADQGPQPLRLGVLAGRDVMATMAAIQPIPETLTRTLGREVEILPLSSYAAMIDAQAQRRIDGGFYSASSYALSEANCGCLEPIVAPAAADGSVAYYAIVVAGPRSGIATLADLQGKTVAMGADDSIGARRMQLAGLVADGGDPSRFGAVREVESGEQAVRLVISGEADAAFAWSSMVGEPQSGYSRGTLADLVARGELDMSQIAVVWRSSPITHGPLAVAKTMDETVKNQIEAYLVGLERAEPAAYDMLNPYYSGGYVAVEPDDYSGLETLVSQNIEEINLPPSPIGSPSSRAD